MRSYSRFIGPVVITLALTTAGLVAAQSGEALYKQKCGRCHPSLSPTSYSAEQWPGLVRSMKHHATLSSEDMIAITNYLVGASGGEGSDTTSASSGSSDGSSGPEYGGYLYTEYFKKERNNRNFDIHYLAFYASGWINERISYLGEFELEHGGRGDNTFVEQAYIDFWLNQNIAVKVGAMLTPFNRFDEFHDPLTNVLITRPQVSRELGVSAWKDVGVDLHGYFNLDKRNSLAFDIYTINGLGSGKNLRGSRQYRDNNEELAYGARFNLLLYDVFEFGVSGYQGAWDDAGDFKMTMVGAHVLIKTDIVDVYGEYADAESENPAVNSIGDPLQAGTMTGFFGQLTRLFDEKNRGTIRMGHMNYKDNADVLGRSPSRIRQSELALGFTHYPTPKVAIKAEYTVFKNLLRGPFDYFENQIGLQAAVKF